jgi:hypothetical protein
VTSFATAVEVCPAAQWCAVRRCRPTRRVRTLFTAIKEPVLAEMVTTHNVSAWRRWIPVGVLVAGVVLGCAGNVWALYLPASSGRRWSCPPRHPNDRFRSAQRTGLLRNQPWLVRNDRMRVETSAPTAAPSGTTAISQVVHLMCRVARSSNWLNGKRRTEKGHIYRGS